MVFFEVDNLLFPNEQNTICSVKPWTAKFIYVFFNNNNFYLIKLSVLHLDTGRF